MAALGQRLQSSGWRVSIYTDPEFAHHIPEGVEHVPIALPVGPASSSSSAVARFRDDWREMAHVDHNGTMAMDFAYQFAMVTKERRDGSCKLEDYHAFVAICMDHMRSEPPDCVLADFICFVPQEAGWLRVFCEERSIAILRLNSQAQPDMLVGNNLFRILYLAFAKGLFRQMVGSDSLSRMPQVMARSTKMMEDRGYRNDPTASRPFTLFSDGNRLPHTIFPTVPSLFFDRWEEGEPARIESWMSLVGPLVRSDPGSAALRDEAPELADWLEGDCPCVYVSFGTLVTLSSDFVSRLCAALLPQGHLDAPSSASWRVLWSLRREFWDLVPDAARESGLLRLEPFVPQEQVLQTEQVCMMVSHHGQNSTTECLVAGKPMVGLPFFTDQHHWARVVERSGASIRLDKSTPSSAILQAIEEILANPQYTKAAQKLSAELRSGRPAAEQISDSLQAAVSREVAKRTAAAQPGPGRAAPAGGVARVGQPRQHPGALAAALLTALLLRRALRARRPTPASLLSMLGALALLGHALNVRGQLASLLRSLLARGK